MKILNILLLLLFVATAANSYDGMGAAFNVLSTFSKVNSGRTYSTANTANTTHTTQGSGGLYIGAVSSFRSSSKYKDIVGSGRYDELIIGFYAKDSGKSINGGRLYMSFYYNDKQSNERGYAYGFEVDKKLMENIPLYLTMGAEFGDGYQHVGDSERTTNDRPIKMVSNIRTDSLTGLIGLSYPITEHFVVDLTYTPSLVQHKVRYRYSDSYSDPWQRTVERHLYEFVNGVRFGASFRF
jgi:hypothetical protein